MLASETAEKPRVKPSPESRERAAQPAQSLKFDTPKFDELKPEALPLELLIEEEAHRAAAERSAPAQARRANRIRIAVLVGISASLAGLALYGWNTLRPAELDELQVTLPIRAPGAMVESAPSAIVPKVQPAPAQTAIGRVQPAPAPAPVQTAVAPTRVQPAPIPPVSRSRTPAVTHTRGGAAQAAVAAPAAVPEKTQQAETNPNCAEGIAALGLCK